MKKNRIGVVLLLEGLVILMAFVVELIISAGGLYMLYPFFDLSTLICIVLFTLPTLFASGAAEDFVRAFQIGKKAFSIGQMKKSLEAVQMMQKMVLYACLFTVGINLVVMLYNMQDPATIGPSLAVAILSLLYASVLEILLLPLHLHVQNWLTDAMDIINEEE